VLLVEVDLVSRGGPEKAFLVAVDTGPAGGWTQEDSLRELAALARTAGAEVVGSSIQKRDGPHPTHYVGTGKTKELVEAKEQTGFTLLVADEDLTPKQQRTLEDLLDVKVLDRSGLILDIFAQRAKTHEGRLQVELAQLEYQLPRLTRLWTHLSRTGGGIGTRGPGETQLETDRRIIRGRIKDMRGRVEAVRQRRETAARARTQRSLPTVAIVGYTNAGKSSLLNALVGEEVVAVRDKLFATLDPTSRRVELGKGQEVIVSDTVGFIRKLPHHLVDAFQATLEEVVRADLLLIVVDASDPGAGTHVGTVNEVLDQLGAGHSPRVLVSNKQDLVNRSGTSISGELRDAVRVSAASGQGLEDLRGAISDALKQLWEEVDVMIPYTEGQLLSRVRERGAVEVKYRGRYVRVRGKVVPSLAGELRSASETWHGGSEDSGDEGDPGRESPDTI